MHYSDHGCWVARGRAEQENRANRAQLNGGDSGARTKRGEDGSGPARLRAGGAGSGGAEVRLLWLGRTR